MAAVLLWRVVAGHRRVAAIVGEAGIVVVPGRGAPTLVHPQAGPLAAGILGPGVVLPPSALELPFKRLPPIRVEIRFLNALADVRAANGDADGAVKAQVEAERLGSLCP